MEMKRIAVVVIINLILNLNGIGQNLVPNGGFEVIDSCSFGSGAIVDTVAPPWDSPSAGSVDLYNTCSSHFYYSVPANGWGYQYPHTGNGYAGGAFYSNGGVPGEREYLQVELDSTLLPNQKYCASFYVNLTNFAKWGNNNFGMCFSTTHVFVSNYDPLNLIPQINDTNIVSDTANWTLVYGQYIAQGGEKYIIIGNFYTDAQTDTIHFNANGTAAAGGYYFIDDVNVHCCSCDSLNHEGITELTKENEITISPNPATTSISITSTNNIKEIKLINLLGEEVIITNYQLRISPSTPLRVTDAVSVDVSSVSKGIYFVEVTDAKDNVINRKVVVQ